MVELKNSWEWREKVKEFRKIEGIVENIYGGKVKLNGRSSTWPTNTTSSI